MSSTLIGDCINCGHNHTKHKGIDPKLRLDSRCTGKKLLPEDDPRHAGMNGRVLEGPERCDCPEYITKQKV